MHTPLYPVLYPLLYGFSYGCQDLRVIWWQNLIRIYCRTRAIPTGSRWGVSRLAIGDVQAEYE